MVATGGSRKSSFQQPAPELGRLPAKQQCLTTAWKEWLDYKTTKHTGSHPPLFKARRSHSPWNAISWPDGLLLLESLVNHCNLHLPFNTKSSREDQVLLNLLGGPPRKHSKPEVLLLSWRSHTAYKAVTLGATVKKPAIPLSIALSCFCESMQGKKPAIYNCGIAVSLQSVAGLRFSTLLKSITYFNTFTLIHQDALVIGKARFVSHCKILALITHWGVYCPLLIFP